MGLRGGYWERMHVCKSAIRWHTWAMSAQTSPRSSGALTVYTTVRAQIIDGTLAPDLRLTEPELAHSLGVSRTPVREALRLLMAEGLVLQQVTGGMRVAPLRSDDLNRIYDIRARLEGLLARDAAARMDVRFRHELLGIVEVMERTRGVDGDVLDLGRQFHAKIAECADNRWCVQLLHQIRGHVDRFRAWSTSDPGRPDEAVTEHGKILQALLAGDPDAAERAMLAHVARSAHAARRALRLD